LSSTELSSSEKAVIIGWLTILATQH
jgi:hypothetical protein